MGGLTWPSMGATAEARRIAPITMNSRGKVWLKEKVPWPKFGEQKQNADGGDDGRAHETANGATAASASKLSTHLCNLLGRAFVARRSSLSRNMYSPAPIRIKGHRRPIRMNSKR